MSDKELARKMISGGLFNLNDIESTILGTRVENDDELLIKFIKENIEIFKRALEELEGKNDNNT